MASCDTGEPTWDSIWRQGLRDGFLPIPSAFTASVQMRDADIAEVLAIAGYDYPASGKMDLFVHASGTRAQPHAEAPSTWRTRWCGESPFSSSIPSFRSTGNTFLWKRCSWRMTKPSKRRRNLRLPDASLQLPPERD